MYARNILISLIYQPLVLMGLLVVLYYVLGPVCFFGVLGSMWVYYAWTGYDCFSPASPILVRFHAWLFRDLLCYVRVQKSAKYVQWEQGGGRCIYAWVPHAFVPATLLTRATSRRDVIMVSSIFRYIPLLNVWTWLRGGVMEITAQNLLRCIRADMHMHMFPGGVRETMSIDPLDPNNFDNVYTNHMRFIEIAYNSHTPVVPVVVLNECAYYKSILPKDWMLWIYERTKIPLLFPYVCVPSHRRPIKIVYADPIYPREYASVREMHAAYYDSVKRLFSGN